MGLLLSPTQKAHLEKGKQLFFSPEAIALRDDPILGGTAQKLAALDHFLGGWKNLADRGVDGRTKKAHGNFDLANDDPVDLDPQERNQLEIDETKRFMS